MQAGRLSEGSISSTPTRTETNKIHKNWIQSSVERYQVKPQKNERKKEISLRSLVNLKTFFISSTIFLHSFVLLHVFFFFL